jgi:hypothetical protein
VIVVPQAAADRQVVVRRQDDLRPVAADHARDLDAILERVLDATVPEVQALAHVQLQDLARLPSLLGAQLGRAPAHVAGRHVDDAGGPAQILELAQQSAAGDLGIVGMRAEREDVDRHEDSGTRGAPADRGDGGGTSQYRVGPRHAANPLCSGRHPRHGRP